MMLSVFLVHESTSLALELDVGLLSLLLLKHVRQVLSVFDVFYGISLISEQGFGHRMAFRTQLMQQQSPPKLRG